MKRIVLFLLAFVTAASLSAPGHADDRTIYIRHDRGGDVGLYQIKAQVARELKLNVVIDGLCASACTLLVGLPKAQVCATGRARLHFHRARLARPMKNGRALLRRTNADILSSYPAGIRRWITRHGGLGDRMLKMEPADVARYLPPCPPAPMLF